MKKFVLGILAFVWLGFWTIFAQNITPDNVEIEVKTPVIQWEATNIKITMMKNWAKMTTYNGTIYMWITEENWNAVRDSEYVLPNNWLYTFEPTDLWVKEFQKWLEIKKEWRFYIKIFDIEDNELWSQLIQVIKAWGVSTNNYINVLNPYQNATLRDEKIEIIAQVTELPNSNIIIYLDDNKIDTTISDQNWGITHTIGWLSQWNHTLKLESTDIDWNIMWSSDRIAFTYTPLSSNLFRNITVEPEDSLREWDIVDVTVYTDETVESVKLKLSDRADGITTEKKSDGVFFQRVFMSTAWDVSISLDISAANGSVLTTEENVKTLHVWYMPEIWNIQTDIDDINREAKISWEVINWPVSSYLIKYWVEDSNFSGEDKTDVESFKFTEVPYDTEFSVSVTPYLNDSKHGAASKTIQFIIKKPQTTVTWTSATGTTVVLPSTWPTEPKCTVQNIATRQEKIWNNHYLIWDKVENVSKYIVYSSSTESGRNRVKVYETTDTSYEYPFDDTAKEEKFAYFWIVWICDDGEELELSWATKVQVWPAENFFLLICLTLLIYCWIKLFRETEI